MNCNIERWASLLGDLTYGTLFVPLTPADAGQLLEAYKDTERRPDAVKSAAAAYPMDLPPLNLQETVLRTSLGPPIQSAIDSLSNSDNAEERWCFVKLSSRSPKDAAARSGAFKTFYKAAISSDPVAYSDPNVKIKILCQAESIGLRFSSSAEVIRALILSERVWQVTI